jgi:transcriptional regulator with XRE-family HTH domain
MVIAMDQTVDDRDWIATVERRPRCGRPGQRLKTLRNGRNITVREVEQASRRIAEEKGDKRFCISNGWLAQLENGVSEPNIQKFFSLSVIYRVSYVDLLRLYDVDVDEREKYETIADPSLTQVISHLTAGEGQLFSEIANTNERLDTDLIPQSKVIGNHSSEIIYARLGLTDFTLHPMIRPGAILKIDTTQNKLSNDGWHNEYERPIYFIELRGGYACGWCELHGTQLLIIPHHSSQAKVRGFKYPREAEIVGRVIGYTTLCIDSR